MWWTVSNDMFIPIRQRIGLGQLLLAGAAGVFIQLYAWSPIMKEKLEKEKKLKETTAITETDPKT